MKVVLMWPENSMGIYGTPRRNAVVSQLEATDKQKITDESFWLRPQPYVVFEPQPSVMLVSRGRENRSLGCVGAPCLEELVAFR